MIRRRAFAAVLGTALTLGSAGLSGASTWLANELEARWKALPWRLGPLRLSLRLALRDAGFDSNIYGTVASPVADLSFILGPDVGAFLPLGRRLLVHVEESPQYAFFLKTGEERAWNNALRGTVYVLFNRFILSGGAGISDAKQKWSAEIDFRPRLRTESRFGSALVQLGRRLSISTGYQQSLVRYDSLVLPGYPLPSRLDRTEKTWHGTIHLQTRNASRWSLAYEATDYAFTDAASQDDALGQVLRAGLEFGQNLRLGGGFSLGWKVIRPRGPGRTSFQGLVGRGRVSLRFLQKFAARLAYERDLPFSLLFRNTVVVDQQVAAGVSFYPMKDIRLDYEHRDGRLSYPTGDRLDAPAPSGRNEAYRSDSLGFVVRVKERFGVGLSFGRWSRESAWTEGMSRRWFAGASFTYEF